MRQLSTVIYECSKCDAQSPKWMGRCSECGEWGSLQENQKPKSKIQKFKGSGTSSANVINLENLQTKNLPRIKTNIKEMDSILGGGIVPGSLILLGGEPGIGKPTLLLQVAASLKSETSNTPILYVSGEESAEQLKTRFDRLKISARNIQYLGDINTGSICATISSINPALAIVDSIQMLHSEESESEPGSVNQIKITTSLLATAARETNVPIIIVGHVTKGGALAGPKTLEHLVDVILEFSGDRGNDLRILRVIKNRFGAAGELAFFEMTTSGLHEVLDPSKLLLADKSDSPGSVVGMVLEGSRPLAIEFQSLINRTNFGYPKRQAVGFDLNKLQLLTAVLSKRTKSNLNFFDAHLKVVGGFRVSEPGADLPVTISLLSALINKPVPKDTVVLGEVGLGGEVRQVSQLDKRLKEAERLGFKNAIVPNCSIKSSKLKLLKIKNIGEALDLL